MGVGLGVGGVWGGGCWGKGSREQGRRVGQLVDGNRKKGELESHERWRHLENQQQQQSDNIAIKKKWSWKETPQLGKKKLSNMAK